MLVLTRRVNECLCIGEGVVVKIISIRGQQVRIGIDAPKSISVDREEVRQLKKLKAAGD